MSVQLSDYDFVIVNTSGGKDSQTTLRHVVQQANSEGYPKSKILIAHADLGRVEWSGARELAIKQAELYGLDSRVVKRPQGDLLEEIEVREMFPGPTTRYCTAHHKRNQIYKIFTQLVKDIELTWALEGKDKRRVRILNVMGMRAEESPGRSKLKPFEHDPRASNGKRHIDRWLPIHEWKLEDVWKDIKASGIPYHRAYDLGMPRLSCVFCVFAPKAALMIAGKHNPELLEAYVQAEKKIGHTFKKDFRIEQVQLAIAAGEDWGPASSWVM